MNQMSTEIEFGYFETGIDQVYTNDNCVELPSSWPKDSKCRLSFQLPSIDLVQSESTCDATTNNNECNSCSQDDWKDDNHISKNDEIDSKTTPSTICNGDHDNYDDDSDHAENHESEIVQTECNSDNAVDVNASSDNDDISNQVIDCVDEHILSTNHNHDEEIVQNNTIENVVEDNKVCNQIENRDMPTDDGVNLLVDDENDSRTNVSSNAIANEQLDKDIVVDNEIESQHLEETTDKPVDTKQSNVDQEPVTPPPKTWAALFRSNTENSTSTVVLNGYSNHKVTTTTIGEKTETQWQNSQEIASSPLKNSYMRPDTTERKLSSKDIVHVKVEDDPDAMWLAERLQNMELIYKPQAFVPRGLINVSNWCFINATLQALLVCPPFYQLLKNLPLIPTEERRHTSTPIMDSFVQLAAEFRQLSTKRGAAFPVSKDVPQGPPFQPTYIYDMLTVIKSSLSEKGKQADAEEFQSCVLNGLHDEMKQLAALVDDSSPLPTASSSSNAQHLFHENSQVMNGGDEVVADEWEEVVTTKKNRSAVTRRADVSRTPISEMFRGVLCSTVFRAGKQKASVSYEAFFSLPIDVQMSWTVDDALVALTNKETFADDGDDSGSRQQTIEVLPPVLILHLKRFVYDKEGGSKKLDKKLEYKTDLVIDKDLLSKSAKKLGAAKRSYKLFAVLYHHGEKATGGHYTTDVFHIGLSSWLRIDDQSVKAVKNSDVTRHHPSRTAYLLYYRRTDLG